MCAIGRDHLTCGRPGVRACAQEGKKPRLYLSSPADNLQAKPLRDGVDAAHNYAANPSAKLA